MPSTDYIKSMGDAGYSGDQARRARDGRRTIRHGGGWWTYPATMGADTAKQAIVALADAADPRPRRLRVPDQGLQVQGGVRTHVDHLVNVLDGGARLDPANLRAACASCNIGKRNTEVAARARYRAPAGTDAGPSEEPPSGWVWPPPTREPPPGLP